MGTRTDPVAHPHIARNVEGIGNAGEPLKKQGHLQTRGRAQSCSVDDSQEKPAAEVFCAYAVPQTAWTYPWLNPSHIWELLSVTITSRTEPSPIDWRSALATLGGSPAYYGVGTPSPEDTNFAYGKLACIPLQSTALTLADLHHKVPKDSRVRLCAKSVSLCMTLSI